MGFRFQKRIKLGKGLGVNISKSSITPSYRSKRGSVSSKGYSIKTGIPGLTFRKTFSKKGNSGCVVTLLIVFFISFFSIVVSCKENNSKIYIEKRETKSQYISMPTVVSKTKKWYEGGTLHKSKITEWKNSTERNKLATCGDFCAKLYENNTLEEKKSQQQI